MSHKGGIEHDHGFQSDVLTKTRSKVERPSRYKVIMVNDDYTPMDFVVHIVQEIFKKTSEEAESIMWTIHNQGSAVCGVYPYEIAETKVLQVLDIAGKEQHPLQCRMEKE